MKEKMTIMVGIGVAVLVIITFMFYYIAKDTIELFEIVPGLIE